MYKTTLGDYNLPNISLPKPTSANSSSMVRPELFMVAMVYDWIAKVKLLFLEGFVEKKCIYLGDLVSFVRT